MSTALENWTVTARRVPVDRCAVAVCFQIILLTGQLFDIRKAAFTMHAKLVAGSQYLQTTSTGLWCA